MNLTNGNGKVISQPTEHDVYEALRQGGDFVILSRGPEEYVQTNFAVIEFRRDGVQLEAKDAISDELMQRVFAAYLRDDPNIDSICTWQELDY